MDAFFASIEQRDAPELRGKPVAVGGSSRRGVVAAASYEARKFGVFSAMPSSVALRKCPHLIFVPSRFEVYREVSQQIRDIFHEYTDLVEPLSLDEAYLDVTHNKIGLPSATLIAREIKKKIKATTELTASAGISINKFLAKIASDQDKPDGLYVITPDMAEEFLEKLPIKDFHGIGEKTAEKMHRLGIHNGKKMKAWNLHDLMRHFGKSGKHFYHMVRAEDDRPVNPHRIRKSVGAETTFEESIEGKKEILEALQPIADKVWGRMEKNNAKGRTITLKIRFDDFETLTRSHSLPYFFENRESMDAVIEDIVTGLSDLDRPVRLLGLAFSNLNTEKPEGGRQLMLEF